MPIVEPAPWRHQYFAHVDCPEDIYIPTDDPEAWAWTPEHRWVFDKLQVALSQGLDAAPHGLEPSHYPVFSKPIYNFGGMGAGSRVLSSHDMYVEHLTPGHMWMPVCKGEHVSTDLAVLKGQSRWIRHATGKALAGGTFDYWTIHAKAMPDLEAHLDRWIAQHLSSYTGMLNIETIGGTIIEAHLRFADQWPDLYGAGWTQALITLYADKTWHFDDSNRYDGYSLALFLPHGTRYRHPPQEVVERARSFPGVSSIQITFHADKPPEEHSMPLGGFRVAVVNGTRLDEAMMAREVLGRWFVDHGVFEALDARLIRAEAVKRVTQADPAE